jgi:hypothetical protein
MICESVALGDVFTRIDAAAAPEGWPPPSVPVQSGLRPASGEIDALDEELMRKLMAEPDAFDDAPTHKIVASPPTPNAVAFPLVKRRKVA